MNKIIALIVFVVISNGINAQIAFELNNITKTQYIDSNYFKIFTDRSNSKNFQDICEAEIQNQFIDFKNISELNKEYSFWLRIFFRNTLEFDYNWLILLGYPTLAEIYIVDETNNTQIIQIGTQELGINKPAYESLYQNFIINLHSKEQKTVYIRIKSNTTMSSLLDIEVSELSIYRKGEQNRYLFQGVFFGLILMMFLYNLFLFFTIRDNSYLYYLLFVGIIGLFFLNINGFLEQIFPNMPRLIFALGASQYFAFIFYFRLLRIFLEQTSQFAKLDKWIKGAIYFSTIGSVLITVILLIDFDIFIFLSSFFTFSISILLIIFSVIIVFKPNKLSRYFVLGTLFMITGVVLMVIQIITGSANYLYSFEIGIAAEIIIFSFGLSYRFKLNELQRLKAQEELIIQLKENERIKDEANHLLEQKVIERTTDLNNAKKKIELNHKRITDSINYASRIQNAMLPSTEILNSELLDYFILHKPKDTVSGDFYWFRKVDNFLFLAVADCTGHGVPGAFMSMLGIAQLNEIITNKPVSSPELILDELRSRIKKSLHQNGQTGQAHDGMDIAFCVIDFKERKIHFSGAYNPLYIIRMNESKTMFELAELKGDKMPIGVHPNDKKSFTKKIIDISQDDTIYIFSDGYVSQFGGERKETFKTKRFQDVLLNIQLESMDLQKQILDKTILSWQGENEQVDDILIIGLKLNNFK